MPDSPAQLSAALDRLLKLQTEFDSGSDVKVIRVYFVDQSHKYIAVFPSTTGFDFIVHRCLSSFGE